MAGFLGVDEKGRVEGVGKTSAREYGLLRLLVSVEILRFCADAVMFDPDVVAGLIERLIEQLGRIYGGAFVREIRGGLKIRPQ